MGRAHALAQGSATTCDRTWVLANFLGMLTYSHVFTSITRSLGRRPPHDATMIRLHTSLNISVGILAARSMFTWTKSKRAFGSRFQTVHQEAFVTLCFSSRQRNEPGTGKFSSLWFPTFINLLAPYENFQKYDDLFFKRTLQTNRTTRNNCSYYVLV